MAELFTLKYFKSNAASWAELIHNMKGIQADSIETTFDISTPARQFQWIAKSHIMNKLNKEINRMTLSH